MGRRQRSTSRNRGHSDDYQDLENELLAPVAGPSPPAALRPPARSALIDDRRRWDPGDTPRDAFGRQARVVMSPKASAKARQQPAVKPSRPRLYQSRAFLREVQSFEDPRRVMICVRRKSRREVLFAIRKTGKGARSRKRRNEWSNVRC